MGGGGGDLKERVYFFEISSNLWVLIFHLNLNRI